MGDTPKHNPNDQREGISHQDKKSASVREAGNDFESRIYEILDFLDRQQPNLSFENEEGANVNAFFVEVGIKALRKEILEIVERSQSLTHGQEGEIYLIESDSGASVLVAKKRHLPGEGEQEFKMHNEVYNLSIRDNFDIKVPKPFDFFTSEDGTDEFIVMEYIHGKTLYTMVWEKIVEDYLLPQVASSDSAIRDYNDFVETYKKDGKISFRHDTETENAVNTLLEIMFLNGLSHDNPSKTEYEHGQKRYPNVEKVYKKYFSKVHVFSEAEGKSSAEKMKKFLDAMHDAGLYHRDIGGNIRNIMFTEDGTPALIDFGKSIHYQGKYHYTDDLHDGEYIDDNSIIPIIKSLSGKQKDDEGLVEASNYKGIKDGAKLLGLDISDDDIRLTNSVSATINPRAVYTDFVDRNDRLYDWFIHKNLKTDEKKKSTVKGMKRMYIHIQTMDDKEKEDFKLYLEEKKGEYKRNSRGYYYADLFLSLF